jgi:tetratricopeptide (TPR) repeat protein
MRSFFVAAAVGLWAIALAGPARAVDERELRAREAFAAGRYQEALDAYSKLYAETLHPTYLRNIGRCYQSMGEPDKAIASFRNYLRRARDLAPGKRQEIEGYIHEMEELKRARERAPPAAAPPAAGTPPAAAAPVGVTAAPVAGAPPAPSPEPTSTPIPTPTAATESPRPPAAPAHLAPPPSLAASRDEPDPSRAPFYERWWFWTALGAVVAGAAVGTAILAGRGAPPAHCLDVNVGPCPIRVE